MRIRLPSIRVSTTAWKPVSRQDRSEFVNLGGLLCLVGSGFVIAVLGFSATVPEIHIGELPWSLIFALSCTVMAVGVYVVSACFLGWRLPPIKEHHHPVPPQSPEAREGERLLSTIQRHSVAQAKATEMARPHAADIVRTWARQTLNPPSDSQIREYQDQLRLLTYIRTLISEGRGYEEEIVQHVAKHKGDDLQAALIGSRTPDELAGRIKTWSDKVHPVIVNSKLPGKARIGLKPYPGGSLHVAAIIKIEGYGPPAQALMELIENHLKLLAQLLSLLLVEP